MIPEFLTYYLYKLRSPQFIDYVDMGLGIAARYRRSAPYWEKHLKFCKLFQEKAFRSGAPLKKIAVLGAGRLYDINIPSIEKACSELHLFDSDPSLRSVWKRAFRRSSIPVYFHFQDLTGVIQKWSRELELFLNVRRRSEEDVSSFLNSLVLPPRTVVADGLLSSNILSQLSIYWRERAYKLLERYLRIDPYSERFGATKVHEALLDTERRIQLHHLDLLNSSGAQTFVIITDRFFNYYQKDRAAWQGEEALLISVEGHFSQYRVEEKDAWLWHIAPQGVENVDYGIIHEVQAFKFVQSQ